MIKIHSVKILDITIANIEIVNFDVYSVVMLIFRLYFLALLCENRDTGNFINIKYYIINIDI